MQVSHDTPPPQLTDQHRSIRNIILKRVVNPIFLSQAAIVHKERAFVLKGTTKSISFLDGFQRWARLLPVDAELLENLSDAGDQDIRLPSNFRIAML